MTLKADIVDFLKRNSSISRLNFACGSYKVYPTAYRTDVANAINTGAIRLGTAVSAGAGASYFYEYDSLELSPAFSIASTSDQASLVHESTHAHLDIQSLGSTSGHENEAVAYLAEATFLESCGAPPLSSHSIRTVSHRIAKVILAGTYTVSAKDFADLVLSVMAEPHYSSKVLYRSEGFKRSLFNNILRSL